MIDYTIAELLSMGETARTYFEKQLGYDSVNFDHVSLRSRGEHKLEFTLRDEFQKNLDYNMQYKVGPYITVPLDDIWVKLDAWPNREMRELTILARKMATIDADLDKITSAQVLAFVARLQPNIDDLRAQITHLHGDNENVEVF